MSLKSRVNSLVNRLHALQHGTTADVENALGFFNFADPADREQFRRDLMAWSLAHPGQSVLDSPVFDDVSRTAVMPPGAEPAMPEGEVPSPTTRFGGSLNNRASGINTTTPTPE